MRHLVPHGHGDVIELTSPVDIDVRGMLLLEIARGLEIGDHVHRAEDRCVGHVFLLTCVVVSTCTLYVRTHHHGYAAGCS